MRPFLKIKQIFCNCWNWYRTTCYVVVLITFSSSIFSSNTDLNPKFNDENNFIASSQQSFGKPSSARETLKEKFLIAKKRYQPYLNLTNEVYMLADLLNPTIFNEYKKLELKSLYLRTDELSLDEKFATEINELAKGGIREVLIFFQQDLQTISTKQLNEFVRKYNIYINLMIVPVTNFDIEKIQADSIGRKDILGFTSLLGSTIKYTDGYTLTLLNNKETNEIILRNYIEHTRRVSGNLSFVVQEPAYITDSKNPNDEKRIKTPMYTSKNRKSAQVEVSRNIDSSIHAEQQLEEENELDLDLEQADNKFDEQTAIEQAKKMFLQYFYEDYQKKLVQKVNINELIYSIFASFQDMEFITNKALELVMQNYFLFRGGINSDNLPIGLAYKNHILFASDQRLVSMPINEFTVKLKPIRSHISNPIIYSWLPFATKASLSLNDIYRSDIAPGVYGRDEHPAIGEHGIVDIMLDKPFNAYHMAYSYSEQTAHVSYNNNLSRLRLFFNENREVNKQKFLDGFSSIYFYGLSQSDQEKLAEIYNNLQQRGLTKIFHSIVMSGNVVKRYLDEEIFEVLDGGFLLEEEASLFFKKLFQEILPISDYEKLEFFITVLKEHRFTYMSLLEDVFEGLDGFYKKLKEFMVISEISPELQKEMLAQSISIIKKHLFYGNSFKTLLGKLINILMLVESQGGSLKEQLEYLDSEEGILILTDSQRYGEAKELGLNVIHRALFFHKAKAISPNDKDALVQDRLIALIDNTDYSSIDSTLNADLLANGMQYLAAIPVHKRASVATYVDYFSELNSSSWHLSQGCTYTREYDYDFIYSPPNNSLKVMECVKFDEVVSKYRVEHPKSDQCTFAIIYLEAGVDFSSLYLEHELGKTYVMFVIEDDELFVYIKVNNFSKKIALTDMITEEKTKKLSSYIGEYIKEKNQVYQLTEEEWGSFLKFIPELTYRIQDIVAYDPVFIAELSKTEKQHSRGRIRSPIFVRTDHNSYDLYHMNIGHQLNKSELNLPAVLDERVEQCMLEDTCSSIDLYPSETTGTIFESFPNPFVNQPYFKEKPYEDKVALLDGARKEERKQQCYASVGVVTENSNLVTNFTNRQAAENVKLLDLNILSSTGQHYNQLYPDQEFAAYISLFNVLFSKVKVYDDIFVGGWFYSIEQDFNRNLSYLEPKYYNTVIEETVEIVEKENEHQKMVRSFVNIYKENPYFNFAQVVALGLIDILDRGLAARITEKAKMLLPYHLYFTQMLRVLISTPTSSFGEASSSSFDELLARGKNIAKTVESLFNHVDEKKQLIHEMLTKNGKHPENLVFFAAIFGQKQEVSFDEFKLFLSKLEALDFSLKEQLLDSFATTKLPYSDGKIISSNFPVITLSDLDDPFALSSKIALTQYQRISYMSKTMFNDGNIHAIDKSKIDFSQLEAKYNIVLTSEMKSKRFSDIRKNILEDKDFIKTNFTKYLTDQDYIKEIHFDLSVAMFSVFSQHDMGWKEEAKKSMTFLFDPKKRLEDQFLTIESNFSKLSKLLNQCSDSRVRDEFLDHLLAAPNIPHHMQDRLLNYLNSLDQETLRTKGHTLLSLVKSVGNKIMAKSFYAFKIATDYFMQSDIGISLEELYRHIENLVDAKYSSNNIQIIATYCLKNLNYSIIPILSKVDGQAEHIDELVDFMTTVSPIDIESIGGILGNNFEILLSIKDIKKIEIGMDIVLKLKQDINPEQYTLLIKQLMKNDTDYAKLVGSYLLIDSVPKQDRVNSVFSDISHLKKAQTIFSDYKMERFNYDKARVKAKIREIRNKNTDNDAGKEIFVEEQKKLYRLFTSIMAKTRTYSVLNINEIRAKAIELKRRRALSKRHTIKEIEQVDLDYLALSFETLYRSTGKFPRDTQILSLLLTILNSNHVIEEIATGQGKSLISALQAAYLCFTGQTVDVVTSSQDLAKKERQEFSSFFKNLGLNVSRSIITAASEIDAYVKGGINYAIASDLALFRANREFHSNTNCLELNTDVSLIGDEVDFVLTSGINFKLATALVKTNQQETRALFDYIIDFSNTSIFKNEKVARKDDVNNLKLYLEHRFQLYNTSYRYPLTLVQLNDLKNSTDSQAQKLYALHSALSKVSKYVDKLFDKLLSAAVIAKQLVEGVDYVILKEDLDNTEELLQVTPIIKDQPSRKTVFGDGVQSFVHLFIEQQRPELTWRFDISMPSCTIFNISPKNFFDYYRLSGGRIIGMTGTAGSYEEIKEFKDTNKMLTFNFPRYEVDLKIVKTDEVNNKEEQYKRVHDILRELPNDRPVIIFAESTKEAEDVYAQMSSHRQKSQLYAASQDDTSDLKDILKKAGEDGYLTVTTPMLGRGINFYTEHAEGFLGINLCTNITYSTRMQIYGRVARNGYPGKIVSIFNRDFFSDSIEAHMQRISDKEKAERIRSQPLTDVLRYFNHVNQNETINAIECNEFITKTWDKIVAENYPLILEGKKTYAELRNELVKILKKEYPVFTINLDGYLEKIDGTTPIKIDKNYGEDLSQGTCSKNKGSVFSYLYNYVGYTPLEDKPRIHLDDSLTYDFDKFKSAVGSQYNNWSWDFVDDIARSTSLETIEFPGENNQYGLFYSSVAKVQSIIMATHAFELKDNQINLYTEHEYRLASTVPYQDSVLSHEIVLFLYNDKIYSQIYKKDPIEIVSAYTSDRGLPQKIYEGVFTKLQAVKAIGDKTTIELTPQERAAINEYINASGYNIVSNIRGEGSRDNLMLYEFKNSFAAYQAFAKSSEVDQVTNIIDNYKQIKDVDITKLSFGQYQPINIVTKFTSLSAHAESVLTDGKLLFWINRGGGSEGKPGIKVFKIIRDLPYVKDTLVWMKNGPYSQTDTRTKIYNLLREDGDNNIPKHLVIPMPEQIIGNCGWAQTEGMLKAAAITNRLNEIGILHDGIYEEYFNEYDQTKVFTESQEWQKVLKDSEDIYRDFITYDRVKRLEATMLSMDETFKPDYLDTIEQEKINLRRQAVGNPIAYALLKSLGRSVKQDYPRYRNTIYEQATSNILDKIDLEIAIGSKMGKALQRVGSKQSARNILQAYQKNRQNDFDSLNKIYKKIEVYGSSDKRTQDELFVTILDSILNSEYPHFLIQKSLNTNWFMSIEDVQKQMFTCRYGYNEFQPVDILGSESINFFEWMPTQAMNFSSANSTYLAID